MIKRLNFNGYEWVSIYPLVLLYHPSKPVYQECDLFKYIEGCEEEIVHDYPSAIILIAGDFNQLSDHDLQERTGLMQTVHKPARESSCLDRI